MKPTPQPTPACYRCNQSGQLQKDCPSKLEKVGEIIRKDNVEVEEMEGGGGERHIGRKRGEEKEFAK